MDSLGTEVGHKMRSAVKAKLIELGSGSSSGYIDDELPDYVMIMVANKRSKQQMTEDLNLFLGSNTETFVNWLHQVLQKLQEVTLPPPAASKQTKRKSSESHDKKDKKEKKKNKRSHKQPEGTHNSDYSKQHNSKIAQLSITTSKSVTASSSLTPFTSPASSPQTQNQTSSSVPKSSTQLSSSIKPPKLTHTSINDVFAEQLIEQAKQTLQFESSVQIKKIQDNQDEYHDTLTTTIVNTSTSITATTINNTTTADGFDIPTITQIAENAANDVTIRKERNELAELQRRINQAKKQLKDMGSDEESEDDDFINLKADGEELVEEDEHKIMKIGNNSRNTASLKVIQPVYKTLVTNNSNINQDVIKKSQRIPITFHNDGNKVDNSVSEMSTTSSIRKRSIMDRLGSRSTPANDGKKNIISLAANRRMEKQIYVPVFRRKENELTEKSKSEIDRKLSSTLDKKHHTTNDTLANNTTFTSINNNTYKDKQTIVGDLRERVLAGRDKKEHNNSSRDDLLKHRISSRIIVAPAKPDYDEDHISVPVNSVVKIQPRPIISANKQASKNLLLRAVAEAQRSTALIKPRPEIRLRSSTTPPLPPPPPPPETSTPSKKSPCSFTTSHDENDDDYNDVDSHEIVNINLDDIDTNTNDHLTEDYVDRHKHQLYTKKFRENMNTLKDSKENIVIQISTQEQEDYSSQDLMEDDEYLPEQLDRENSDNEGYVYVPVHLNNSDDDSKSPDDDLNFEKKRTQFVVTLDGVYSKVMSDLQKNNKNTTNKLRKDKSMNRHKLRSATTANSSANTNAGHAIKSVLDKKQINKSKNKISSPLRVDISQKVNKLIIKNDTEDEEDLKQDNLKLTDTEPVVNNRKRSKLSPIKFVDQLETKKIRDVSVPSSSDHSSVIPKERSRSKERSENVEHNFYKDGDQTSSSVQVVSEQDSNNNSRKVKTKKNETSKKYENVPPLSSAIISSNDVSIGGKTKSKEKCKYYPTCGKGDTCEFAHPSICLAFPACMFGDKCLYYHPKCKFDLTCTRLDCNYSHTPNITAAAPLSSHVVPVSTYKTISTTPLPAMCKFYPGCINKSCTFFHPKPCHFGKNCINKIECNFYHFDVPRKDKLKWVASTV